MLKPLSVSTESLAKPQPTTDLAARVFRAMHGYYGALFLSKWANGVVENGVDCGVSDAMKVWAYELRRYDAKTVLEAIGRCKTAHPEYPPSLPQFVALCHACRPREAYKPAENVIGMSQALRSEYAAKAREINEKHAKRAVDKRLGAQADVGSYVGLDGLKSAIANAVACAGGDEVATLLRLDTMLAPRVAA